MRREDAPESIRRFVSPPLTIMVVDDDEDNCILVEHRLRKTFKHCAVVACKSGSDALTVLQERPIDAIITDHNLGLETGSDFIRHARDRGVTCPILMVTGSEDPRIQRDAAEAGATKVFCGGKGDFCSFLAPLLEPDARQGE